MNDITVTFTEETLTVDFIESPDIVIEYPSEQWPAWPPGPTWPTSWENIDW